MADKDYVIYKDDLRITVDEALALDDELQYFIYVPTGLKTKTNPWYVIGALDWLQTHNQIDSFVYVGKELEELESEDGQIY